MTATRTETPVSSWVLALWVLLAAAVIVAHGCHGNQEDHELSAWPGATAGR
jgi:hypothetical protein